MAALRHMPLRNRLLLLVLACVLPLSSFALGLHYLNYRAARTEAGQRTLELARGLAQAVERDLQGRLAMLQVLAQSRVLEEGDIEGFRARAEAVIAQQMPGANILLLREDGQQVMNTALPPGAPLPARRDATTLRRLFATARPSVSDLFFSVVARRPIVALEVPVLRPDGSVAYGLTLNPTVDAFEEVIRRQRPRPGWVVSIFDRQGVNIARSPNGERFVGQKASPTLLQHLLAEAEGVFETVSLEGTPLLSAFSRVEGIGWSVAIGVPEAELTGPLRRAALATLAAGSALLLGGLVVAGRLARRITRPIAALRRLAAAPWPELHAEPEAGDLPETAEVAEVLVGTARERRAAAERQVLLAREVDHRAKNALAVVQAVVRMTPRDLPPARFATAIEGRIAAMARAHSLLAATQWSGADLRSLAEGELAVVHDGRVRLEGPPARLAPMAAQPMAMLLHELATNATKHGALSAPGGAVRLAWDFGAEGGGLRLRWEESGGPPVAAPPARSGFGMRLLASLAERQLGGRLDRVWDPAGLRLTLALPPQHAEPAAEGAAPGQVPRPTAAQAWRPVVGRRPRVLVVEDDALLALEVERTVRAMRYEVIGPARSLAEAVRYATEPVLDAAVLDVNLGGEMVFPVADILATRSVPVLFATGYDSAASLAGRDRAAVAVLRKPYPRKALAEALHEALRRGPPPCEAASEQ